MFSRSYDFKPNLAADLASSDIVISHAGAVQGSAVVVQQLWVLLTGAGSVLEALVAKKRLLVVVNRYAKHQYWFG